MRLDYSLYPLIFLNIVRGYVVSIRIVADIVVYRVLVFALNNALLFVENSM